MPSSTTELIKSKLDIVDFLRGYLNPQPAGKNFKALCPFHKEKTPSFMISPDRQSWHCFGCGMGGDIFGFLMRYENLEFGEALRVLAEKAGVELRRLDPAEHKYTGLLYELNDRAKEFFKKELANSALAKKYLAERGLKDETVEGFDLGWAPNAPEALAMNLLNLGYAPDDVLRAGLAMKNDRGMVLDRFRGRIMFPIHNHFGKVVGFTGRIMPQFESAGVGKYVNSPETPVFVKSRLLYGFSHSKNFIREADSVFLVEGQMDFLMSWQAGVKNAVATSGTALTPDHLRVLRRLAEEVVLSFDSDEAGSAAAERAIDLAEANDFSVKVARLEGFKDPAEAAQSNPATLQIAIRDAVAAPVFYFEKYLPKKDVMDYSRRSGLKNLRLVIAKVKNIASAVQRDHWFKELAKRTGIAERILLEEAEKVVISGIDLAKNSEPQAGEAKDSQPKYYSRREVVGERLLRAGAAKNNYEIVDDCVPYLAKTHRDALSLLKKGGRIESGDPGLDELVNFIVLASEDLDDEELATLKQELLKEHFKERRQTLTTIVKNKEASGDIAGLAAAMEELNDLKIPVFGS